MVTKKSASAASHSQRSIQRYMISYNAQFARSRGVGGGNGGTVKREMSGGVSIFPTVGIGKKQMLSIKNRLPSLSNEEFKGWLVGSKMSTDGQHACSKCPYVMSHKRVSVKD